MIAGQDGVYICDECIDLCSEIMEEEFEEMEKDEKMSINGLIYLLSLKYALQRFQFPLPVPENRRRAGES